MGLLTLRLSTICTHNPIFLFVNLVGVVDEKILELQSAVCMCVIVGGVYE